jgi:putative sterol carrier protein
MAGSQPGEVQVRLRDEERSSGLGLMTMQYLQQTLADAPERRRQARGLHGRLALEATDAEVTITVNFRGDEIEIEDGSVPPVHAYVGGPYEALTDLLAGRVNPLREHLRGRLRVRSSLTRPFFPYRVYNLLKLEAAEPKARARVALAVGLISGFVGAIALALVLRRSRIGGGT